MFLFSIPLDLKMLSVLLKHVVESCFLGLRWICNIGKVGEQFLLGELISRILTENMSKQ